jgi:hypothetical protein
VGSVLSHIRIVYTKHRACRSQLYTSGASIPGLCQPNPKRRLPSLYHATLYPQNEITVENTHSRESRDGLVRMVSWLGRGDVSRMLLVGVYLVRAELLSDTGGERLPCLSEVEGV